MVKNCSIPDLCLYGTRICYLVFNFPSVWWYLIRRIPKQSFTSHLNMFWMHTYNFSRFPCYICVPVWYPSLCHQSYRPTEEDISVDRERERFWCGGHLHPRTAQGDPAMAWLMTHGLQNTSSSEPPLHIKKNMHMYKVQPNLLYITFNCLLKSSDITLRWLQAWMHNTFTRGHYWIA